MVNGIEVADHTDTAGQRADQQVSDIALADAGRSFRAYEGNRSDDESEEVSEKALLESRHIAGKPDKQVHKSEAESGDDNEHYTHFIIRAFRVSQKNTFFQYTEYNYTLL